ncbi:hypothetical protein [Hymenobacter rigui]|uniref:Uncharacterized protein n=1 Tax=Hymenobacter rigui TaxID=334424 RepID=A0A3R9N4X2_9BACT|nr:hypothetical protein [Hymenobacter rigui]RSK48329.1 hypothetical protein EI291_11440 [Hymenobacter rigui]
MAAGLIGMGYWRNLLEPQYPDVACFVDDSWSEAERQTALQYLSRGRPLHYWMGMERCLLGCGEHLHITGCTDGTYYWPESLLHYLKQHAVRLPDTIIHHLHQQPAFPIDAAEAIEETAQTDFCWWKNQRGWQTSVTSLQYLSQQEIRGFLRRYDCRQIDYSGLTSATDNTALVSMVAALRQLVS